MKNKHQFIFDFNKLCLNDLQEICYHFMDDIQPNGDIFETESKASLFALYDKQTKSDIQKLTFLAALLAHDVLQEQLAESGNYIYLEDNPNVKFKLDEKDYRRLPYKSKIPFMDTVGHYRLHELRGILTKYEFFFLQLGQK